MATWIVIDADDLNDYLVAAQVDAMQSAALAVGQTDPFGAVMPDVAARIRAEIQGCPRNRVSATANAIPPSLKSIACLLVIESMQARLVGLTLTEEQKTLIKDGRDYLKRISKCEVPIDEPADPLDPPGVQKGGYIEVVTSETRRTSRDKLSGL